MAMPVVLVVGTAIAAAVVGTVWLASIEVRWAWRNRRWFVLAAFVLGHILAIPAFTCTGDGGLFLAWLFLRLAAAVLYGPVPREEQVALLQFDVRMSDGLVMGLQYLVTVATVVAALLWTVASCPENPPL
jgi:hypothetical protein